MGKSKKKFVDKRHAATFQLMFRDSVDANALPGDKIFVRTDPGNSHIPGFSDDHSEPVLQPTHHHGLISPYLTTPSAAVPESVRREIAELGLPDDGYDYTQHLRLMGAGTHMGVFVPVSAEPAVFPTDVRLYDATRLKVPVKESSTGGEMDASEQTEDLDDELEASVLRAIREGTREVEEESLALRLLDPDVLAALEEEGSVGTEGEELEDDFVLRANTGGEWEDDVGEDEEDANEDKHVGDVDEPEEDEFCEGGTEEQFMDERFERLALREYDDDELGELDEDDPSAHGCADISQFADVLDEFLYEQKSHQLQEATREEKRGKKKEIDGKIGGGDTVPAGVEIVAVEARTTKTQVDEEEDGKVDEEEDDEDDEEDIVLTEDEEAEEERRMRDAWDCESIVSTYSNLDNHPAQIGDPSKRKPRRVMYPGERIRLAGKEQIPVDFLPVRLRGVPGLRLPKPEGESETGSRLSKKVVGRRGGETAEEKKARKKELKDVKRDARATKKMLRTVYKQESVKAQHGAAIINPQGIHLQ